MMGADEDDLRDKIRKVELEGSNIQKKKIDITEFK
jgi:hypothetical protein